MKIEFTADTRPIMCTGVIVWINVDRMNTLTMSAAPLNASTATEAARFVDSPNAIIQTPNSDTARSNVLPVF